MDAYTELYESKIVKALQCLQKLEVIIMLALWHELKANSAN
jgi:hypothetical protein